MPKLNQTNEQTPSAERIVTIASAENLRRKTYKLILSRLDTGSLVLDWFILPSFMQRVAAAAAVAKPLGVIREHMTVNELLAYDEALAAFDMPMQTGHASAHAQDVTVFLDGSAKRLLSRAKKVCGLDGFSYTFDFPGTDPIEQWCAWDPELLPVAEQFAELLKIAGIDYDEFGPMISCR